MVGIMEIILDWGLGVILWFQELSPTLDTPFKAITFLGGHVFFLLFLPFIYWSVDRRLGIRFTILFLLSAYINTIAKDLLSQPRPFQYDPRVKALIHAGGGGLPSGHTQNTVIAWVFLAYHYRRTLLWVLAGLLLFLVPLSRIYLGVHFPSDLVGGYVVGGILIFLYLRFEPQVETWLLRVGLKWQLGLVVVMPFILTVFSPSGGKYGITVTGSLLGLGLGYVLEPHWVRFNSKGIWGQRILRYFLGAVVIFAVWFGLRLLFAGLEPAPLFRFLRYGLVGFWAGLGAPWVFVKMGLAEKRQRDVDQN